MRFPLCRFSLVLFVFLSVARFLIQCLLPHTRLDFREFPQTLAQAKGEFGEFYHSSAPGWTRALCCCASVHPAACHLCHSVYRGRRTFTAEAWRAASLLLWMTKTQWLLWEWIAEAQGSNFTWAVLLSDRTAIVRPPEDSTVIKGTTATLRCEATHDPRISIRLVVALLVCVVYPSLIL